MTLLTPGETCWRTETADRVAFLVDTEAYFTALHEAMQKAQRSILILGWAFDPRARLFPDRPTLDAICQYTWEHGLAPQRLKVEDLFAPSTLRDIPLSEGQHV